MFPPLPPFPVWPHILLQVILAGHIELAILYAAEYIAFLVSSSFIETILRIGVLARVFVIRDTETQFYIYRQFGENLIQRYIGLIESTLGYEVLSTITEFPVHSVPSLNFFTSAKDASETDSQ